MASENIALFVAIASIVLSLGYMIWNERRMRLFLRAKGAESLADTLTAIEQELAWAKGEHAKKEAHLARVEGRLRRSIQKVDTIRFNAFGTAGGGQSFATVLLDETGNGVILSTLYHRDRVSVFSKPITSYTSTFALSPEEEEAIKRVRTEK